MPDDRNARLPPRDAPEDSLLSKYFREMVAVDLMSPDEEARAARDVEEREVEHWCVLLTEPRVADAAVSVVERNLTNAKLDERPELVNAEPLRARARELIGGARGDELLLEYVGLCERFAREVRLPDADRLWMNEAARIAFATKAGPAHEDWHRELRRSDREQRAAKLRFVNANLRLVVSIARKYNRGKMPLIDLVQEGNIGLIKAVERFDHSRGYRFSTYASWWIRHTISRSLADKGRAVRIPVHMLDAYNRVVKATAAFLTKHGREPTIDELVEAAEVDRDKVERVMDLSTDAPVSLDLPVGEDGDRKRVDLLEDEGERPDEGAEAMDESARLQEAMAAIPPRAARVVRLLHGIDGLPELAHAEVAARYGLKAEGVRELEGEALEVMRERLVE